MSSDFDFFNYVCTNRGPHKPYYVSIMDIKEPETAYDRKLRMLRQLSITCTSCSMCSLGLRKAEKNNEARDPHLLSNLNPTNIMVVGQNPGWTEIKKREPFVGQAGKNFDNEIQKWGRRRRDFYITNVVKCFTPGNAKPSRTYVDMCSSFLLMEMNVIQPKLIVTLGSSAFNYLCPDTVYADGLQKITRSKYDFPVYAVYHPSPLNLADKSRKAAFSKQVKILCKLIDKIA